MNKKKLPKAIQPHLAKADAARTSSDTLQSTPQKSQARKASAQAAEADVPQLSQDDRRATAIKLVERFSLWSGAAGLFPVPVIDLAAVGAVQIQMLRRISQIYDVPFSKNRGKALIASLAGTMIPASTGLGMASTLKVVPIAGTAIGALTTPALSVGATYVIGMAFVQHFASGGTLLDFEPPNYREFIKAGSASNHSR